MSETRLVDYLEHMRQAALDAYSFTDNLTKRDFLEDKKTQRAVVMSLMIIGESTSKIMSVYPDFVESHSDIQWRGMRGMRNRIVHGYFEINLDIVWNTVRTAIPDLIRHLPSLIEEARMR